MCFFFFSDFCSDRKFHYQNQALSIAKRAYTVYIMRFYLITKIGHIELNVPYYGKLQLFTVFRNNKECALAHSRAERGRLRHSSFRASAHLKHVSAFLCNRKFIEIFYYIKYELPFITAALAYLHLNFSAQLFIHDIQYLLGDLEFLIAYALRYPLHDRVHVIIADIVIIYILLRYFKMIHTLILL